LPFLVVCRFCVQQDATIFFSFFFNSFISNQNYSDSIS
jgi:hypothetical protein